jgi:hypothetical protein
MLTSSREKFLELHVPGLAERRPSVVMGDRVYLTPADGVEGTRTRQQSAQTGGPKCEYEVSKGLFPIDPNAAICWKLELVLFVCQSGFRPFECRSYAHAYTL